MGVEILGVAWLGVALGGVGELSVDHGLVEGAGSEDVGGNAVEWVLVVVCLVSLDLAEILSRLG